MNELTRYSVIHEKCPREIVLLRGTGCKWRKCSFCDYHLDSHPDNESNFILNSKVLDNVTGVYGEIEVINSGSMADLDSDTIELIKEICIQKEIHTIHIESHWMHRHQIMKAKDEFKESGITLKSKIGLETFDYDYRENVLIKGINEHDPAVIARYFDEANLLQGVSGQNIEMLKTDIELGLKYFERICINIMTPNSMPVKPDAKLTHQLAKEVYPQYINNDRVDILMNNTDFGVG